MSQHNKQLANREAELKAELEAKKRELENTIRAREAELELLELEKKYGDEVSKYWNMSFEKLEKEKDRAEGKYMMFRDIYSRRNRAGKIACGIDCHCTMYTICSACDNYD